MNAKKPRVAIHGAAGRMGQRLVALGAADNELLLAAAIDAPTHPRLGEDAGTIAGAGPLGLPLTGELGADADVVIDFSVPVGTAAILAQCLKRSTPLVVATTGLPAELQEQVRAAANSIAVLWSPSMSLAVNLTMKLAGLAATALKDHATGADVEIIERHHRFKEDAPSGTALKFGQIIADAMGISGVAHGREGRTGQRPRNEIGYHAVRTGDNPGEHTILFGMLGESIELTVRASNRDCYAFGALAAAKFLVGQPAGLYQMSDVLAGC